MHVPRVKFGCPSDPKKPSTCSVGRSTGEGCHLARRLGHTGCMPCPHTFSLRARLWDCGAAARTVPWHRCTLQNGRSRIANNDCCQDVNCVARHLLAAGGTHRFPRETFVSTGGEAQFMPQAAIGSHGAVFVAPTAMPASVGRTRRAALCARNRTSGTDGECRTTRLV